MKKALPSSGYIDISCDFVDCNAYAVMSNNIEEKFEFERAPLLMKLIIATSLAEK